MPKMNMDYSKCVIYRIVCKDLNITECYVGHTTNLIQRKYRHSITYTNPNTKDYNYKINQYIRENGGWSNFELIEIEKYPCSDINEATKRERYWKEFYNANLNSNIPSRTKKEWNEDNADKLKKYHKEYYNENADKILEKAKQYQIENKEKINERKKEYIDKNANKIKKYQKKWYIENADKILEKQSEKIICECGCEITRGNLNCHLKTKKHQELINLSLKLN
jgi:hypothetical protein